MLILGCFNNILIVFILTTQLCGYGQGDNFEWVLEPSLKYDKITN